MSKAEQRRVKKMTMLFDRGSQDDQRKMLAHMASCDMPDGFAIVFTADAAWVDALPGPAEPTAEPARCVGLWTGLAVGLSLGTLVAFRLVRETRRGA